MADADEHWVTINGARILIKGSGDNAKVIGGAEGKFNGKTLKEVGSGEQKSKPQAAANKPRLTPTEKSYITSYSGDEAYRVNNALRAGNSDRPIVRHLDAAIAKATMPEGTKLYRGMNQEAAKKWFGKAGPKVGKTVSDKAFLSTGKSGDFVSNFYGRGGVVLEIETGEGQNGLDLNALKLSDNKSEGEVLLPRNTKLKIKSIEEPKKVGDARIIRVTSIPDSGGRSDSIGDLMVMLDRLERKLDALKEW